MIELNEDVASIEAGCYRKPLEREHSSNHAEDGSEDDYSLYQRAKVEMNKVEVV